MPEHRRDTASLKRFYDWFYLFYGAIELMIGRSERKVMRSLFDGRPGLRDESVLELACGTGLLTLELARRFGRVEARDISTGMLGKATRRLARRGFAVGEDVVFREGDMAALKDPDGSFDRVFISYALHLLPPDKVPGVLKRLVSVCRKEVVVIDHSLRWKPMTALVEWVEGSYYDKFIGLDFIELAKSAGARSFSNTEIAGCSVLVFGR